MSRWSNESSGLSEDLHLNLSDDFFDEDEDVDMSVSSDTTFQNNPHNINIDVFNSEPPRKNKRKDMINILSDETTDLDIIFGDTPCTTGSSSSSSTEEIDLDIIIEGKDSSGVQFAKFIIIFIFLILVLLIICYCFAYKNNKTTAPLMILLLIFIIIIVCLLLAW